MRHHISSLVEDHRFEIGTCLAKDSGFNSWPKELAPKRETLLFVFNMLLLYKVHPTNAAPAQIGTFKRRI